MEGDATLIDFLVGHVGPLLIVKANLWRLIWRRCRRPGGNSSPRYHRVGWCSVLEVSKCAVHEAHVKGVLTLVYDVVGTATGAAQATMAAVRARRKEVFIFESLES